MRIFTRKRIVEFYKKYPDSKKQLESWHKIIKNKKFLNPNEVIAMFSYADIIGDGIIVFNICGNKYRLVVRMRYDNHMAYIKFLGTHNEYNELDL